MQINLDDITLALAQDLQDLRDGKINNSDGRVRAQLAREILRAVQLKLEGMKVIEGQALKSLPGKKEA